ncbi:unhealthy ribosome biogenesis protein 2 homolog [Anabrus simplex]|uniref:unhealthy ribosome biogenesis protein 2 homolog n=1 Tax=Anabrus simplex TaxID=316456 RepID=UPI0035A3D562
MALSSELQRRLKENSVPLSKRLLLAKNSFKHTELLINKKEELVLNWLCEESLNNAHSVEIWQTLFDCLSSNRMLNLSATDIRSSEKAKLIQVLSDSLNKASSEERSYIIILQCISRVLENSHFQDYFRKQLQDYIALNKVFFRGISQIQDAQLFTKTVENLVSFYKQLSNKDEFSKLFVREIIIALVESYCNVKSEDTSGTIKLKVIHCVERIVFPRAKHSEISGCIRTVFGSSIYQFSDIICELFVLLSNAVTSLPENIISDVINIVFQAFALSYKNESSVICWFFVILCYFIGFKPNVRVAEGNSVHLITHKNFKTVFQDKVSKCSKASVTSLLVLRSLLEVLSENNVQLDLMINNVSFRDWLEVLVSSVLKIKIHGITFDVLNCIIQLNPLIIEAKISSILECTLFVQEDFIVLKPSYISFLHCVLVMFNKLHRLQKFTSKFLTTILDCTVVNSAENGRIHLTSSDILPKEICHEFCDCMTTLPGSQCIEMMKSLTYHVHQDCVEILEKNIPGEGFLLYVEVLADVLCHFLDGVRMAEHSIPIVIVEKFINGMAELRGILGQLGTALLHKEHCHRLMVAFLRMCYSCGELQILLLHYSPGCEKNKSLQLADMQGDNSATNLECLHSYLTHEQWNLVAQRIRNFGEDACKEMLNKLVLQKLRVAILFNGDSLEVCTPIVKHVLDHINELWPLLLGNNATLLMPLLNTDQLQEMANYLVLKLVTSESELHVKALSSTTIQENRSLVLALALGVLNQINQLFTKRKRKLNHSETHSPSNSQLARHVLSVLNLETILNQSEEHLSPIISELATVINKACESYDNAKITNGFTLDASLLENYLKLLKNLPLLYLSRGVRTLLVFSILAVAVSLSPLAPDNTDKLTGVRKLYAELLLVLLEGPNPPNLAAHLHLGQLMTCLPDLGLAQPLLLQHLFSMCLRQEGALEQLEVGVPLLDLAGSKQECNSASLDSGTLLLKCLSKVKKNRVPKEDRILCRKFKKRLSRGIVRYIKRCNSDISPQTTYEMLEAFSLALQNYVAGSEKNLNKITPYLNSFIETAISSLSDASQPSLASITLLGTVLQHKSKLEQSLPSDFIAKVWAVLSSEQHARNTSGQLTRLLEVANEEEFQRIIKDLLTETHSCTVSEKCSRLPYVLNLWKCIALSSVNKAKSEVQEAALHEACLYMVSQFTLGAAHSYVVPLLELDVTLAKRRLVKASSPLLDLFLETVANLPLKEKTSLEDFVATINTSLELLTTVLLHWSVLVISRIPPFLQCFRHVVSCIAKRGSLSEGLSEREVAQLANCAHGIERLTNAIVKYKKDFAPVSGFVIADTLHQLEKYTIYPSVKIHLNNSIYILLRICDKYSLAHLFRALPPGSKELFSNVYRNYKKYYRFTGKV